MTEQQTRSIWTAMGVIGFMFVALVVLAGVTHRGMWGRLDALEAAQPQPIEEVCK